MSFKNTVLSAFFSFSVVSFLPISATAATIDNSLFTNPNPTTLETATQAYIWGYPLIALRRTEALSLATEAPVNQFAYRSTLATPADRSVVRPNNDTLYASSFLDLSQTPLILQVPNTNNRYYSLQFLDAYTNTFAYVGTRENDLTAGRYGIVGPHWSGSLPNDLTRVIQAPSNTVWLLGRTLVDGPSDLAAANALQEQYKLSYYPESPSDPFPSVPITGSPANIAASGLGFYSELNNNLVANPAPEDEAALMASFATIGVGVGLTPAIDVSTAEAAIAIGESLMDQQLAAVSVQENNWLVNYSIGSYGDDYLLRSAIAQSGLGANTAEEALYFSTEKDVEGQPLMGNQAYKLSFTVEQLPPVSPQGFWSITLYDQDGFLVENSIARYSIGNRTEGLKYNADGSLDIFLQNQTPIGFESNWLPTPTGAFNLTLRAYLPQEELLNQSYRLQGVQPVPEPLTILGSFAAIGFGFLSHREWSKSSKS